MWLKLLLLTLYLLFVFILSRILEASSFYQDTDAFFTSFAALDPLKLSVKKLKQILDNRGITYSGVVEKTELVELVQSSGKATDEELIDTASLKEISPKTTHFTCGSHFYEEVEDTKDSAWLVQVIVNEEKEPLIPESVWREIVSEVSGFGIRTGYFKCSLDKRLCKRKGWISSRLILALPRGKKAKEDVILYDYLQPSSSSAVLQWVKNRLASWVKEINSSLELKKWLQSSDNQNVVIKVVFMSILKSCPMFLSSLAIKFNGRVKFAFVDITKDNYKKSLNGVQFPIYLVQSPEKTFTYGAKKGECFKFKSMELFLKTLVPEMNDVFLWSLLFVNVLASFELFFMHCPIWKHFLLYAVCVIKYNSVLFLFWLLILALNQFSFMLTCSNILLKCLRVASTSCIGSMIRSDYKNFYSYTFLLVSFVVFASVSGFLLRKFKWVEQNNSFLSPSWSFLSWDGLFATYFFQPISTLTRPSVPQDLDLEIGMELLIERLAVPNLWLQPMISMDYVKDLQVWKYQGWCEADDVCEESRSDTVYSSDDESANITNVKKVVQNIVPRTETSIDNHSSSDISACPDAVSQNKNQCSPHSDTLSNSNSPSIPSAAFCSEISKSTSYEVPDSERAPKGMLEFRECSICLENYRYNEYLCGLPCGHNFHINCIMMWIFRDNHCCPVCRWPTYKVKKNVHHAHFQ